jgi:hypothetical protein
MSALGRSALFDVLVQAALESLDRRLIGRTPIVCQAPEKRDFVHRVAALAVVNHCSAFARSSLSSSRNPRNRARPAPTVGSDARCGGGG